MVVPNVCDEQPCRNGEWWIALIFIKVVLNNILDFCFKVLKKFLSNFLRPAIWWCVYPFCIYEYAHCYIFILSFFQLIVFLILPHRCHLPARDPRGVPLPLPPGVQGGALWENWLLCPTSLPQQGSVLLRPAPPSTAPVPGASPASPALRMWTSVARTPVCTAAVGTPLGPTREYPVLLSYPCTLRYDIAGQAHIIIRTKLAIGE